MAQDRFAFGARGAMLDGYVMQWKTQLAIEQPPIFVDSEDLLCQHLKARHLQVDVTNFCLVRIRVGGVHVRPDYVSPREASNCTFEDKASQGETASQEDPSESICPEPPMDAVSAPTFVQPSPIPTVRQEDARVEEARVKEEYSTPQVEQGKRPSQGGKVCWPFAPELPFAVSTPLTLPLKLADPTYYKSVSHRGGWRSVIEGLIDSGIVYDGQLEAWQAVQRAPAAESLPPGLPPGLPPAAAAAATAVETAAAAAAIANAPSPASAIAAAAVTAAITVAVAHRV